MDHPYYPVGLSLPHYVPNKGDALYLVSMFAIVLSSVLIPSYILINRKHGNFQTSLVFLWFVSCGCIHFFFEGYFAVFHESLAGHTTLFGELWKEYSKSDSRYLSSDSFVLFMEALTAFCWGPLSFLIAYWIYNDDNRRHLPIVVVSAGQIYGDILYYMTTLFEGAPHGSPDPYYFYFYFVFMNAIWIVIPTIYGIKSAIITLDCLSKVGNKEVKAKKIQ